MTTTADMTNQAKDYQLDERNNSRSKDCLIVKPNRELTFTREQTNFVAEISLSNKKDEPVLFKVRTTAAKSYLVSPIIGILAPYETIPIKVVMGRKEQTRDRANDRFLIQAFAYKGDVHREDQKALQEVFDQVHSSATSKEFQNTRLKVHFEHYTIIEEEMSEEYTPAKVNSPSTAETKFADPIDSYKYSKGQPPSGQASGVKQPYDRWAQENQPAQKEEESSFFNFEKEKDANSNLKDTANQYNAENRRPSSRVLDYSNTSREIAPNVSYQKEKDALSNLRDTTNQYYVESQRPSYAEGQRPSSKILDYSNTSQEIIPKYGENVLSSSQKDIDARRVSRDLRNEFENDRIRASLSQLSSRRNTNVLNENDVSIISEVKSVGTISNQLTQYKTKLETLEQKFNQQENTLAQIKDERDQYLNEMEKMKTLYTPQKTNSNNLTGGQRFRRQFDLWHLMVVSVISLILGALCSKSNFDPNQSV